MVRFSIKQILCSHSQDQLLHTERIDDKTIRSYVECMNCGHKSNGVTITENLRTEAAVGRAA